MIKKNYHEITLAEWKNYETELSKKSAEEIDYINQQTFEEFRKHFTEIYQKQSLPIQKYTPAAYINFIKLTQAAQALASLHAWNFSADFINDDFAYISFSASAIDTGSFPLDRAIFNLLHEKAYSVHIAPDSENGNLVKLTLHFQMCEPNDTPPSCLYLFD